MMFDCVNLTLINDYEAIFMPMIPRTIRARLIDLNKFRSSPKSMIPAIAVPTVPIPTQTPYATPNGKLRNDKPKRTKLIIIHRTVRTEGKGLLKPSVYFKPTAQAISLSPAKKSINQAILLT